MQVLVVLVVLLDQVELLVAKAASTQHQKYQRPVEYIH
tara:strand:- start:255 stop:368 length:114 start_codon:yes stop_codon:yes gene_type:complete